jgi:hypothetical protein
VSRRNRFGTRIECGAEAGETSNNAQSGSNGNWKGRLPRGPSQSKCDCYWLSGRGPICESSKCEQAITLAKEAVAKLAAVFKITPRKLFHGWNDIAHHQIGHG